jgi:IclR family acetate operon transcriptional repressor
MESVRTALRVLERVGELGQAGLSELARALGEPKSTIQRDLMALHAAGWIRPVEKHGRRGWALSAKVATLARRVEPARGLREQALAAMEGLRERTRETVHLTILDGERVVLIERLDSPQTLRTVRPLGASAPLHATSNGKAILSRLPQAALDAYLARPLAAVTARTLTDPAALARSLAEARRAGYALGDRELDPEVRAVAAAIVSETGEPIAAMSISCPASRFPDALVESYGALVREAAAQVSAALAAPD